MPIEARQGRERAALQLDDGDAQTGRVKHELLERLAPLWDDQQPDGRTAGGERLLDRAPASNQLLVRTQEVGRRQGDR